MDSRTRYTYVKTAVQYNTCTYIYIYIYMMFTYIEPENMSTPLSMQSRNYQKQQP